MSQLILGTEDWEIVCDASLEQIKKVDPEFFEKKMGRRETYTAYRGFLIVRYTTVLNRQEGRWTTRRTALYTFDGNGLNYHSAQFGICQSKRLVDRLLGGRKRVTAEAG